MDLIDLINRYLTAVALVSVADSVNQGRQKVYDDLGDSIGALMWSAILDEHVCPICRELDGKYFSPKDPLLDYIRSPIHQGCRCILVGVLKEELEVQNVRIHKITYPDLRRWTKNKFWLL